MKKLTIKMTEDFYAMLRNNEIKSYWTIIEWYGIEVLIKEIFEEELENDDVWVDKVSEYGVLEAFLHEGFHYGDVHINSVYIHKNNDIILMGEGENMLILENEGICECMLNS